MRLQTTGKPAHAVMKDGIGTLIAATDAMSDAFEAALQEHDAKH